MTRTYRVLRKVAKEDGRYAYETSHYDVTKSRPESFEAYEKEHLTEAKGVLSFASWPTDDERGFVT